MDVRVTSQVRIDRVVTHLRQLAASQSALQQQIATGVRLQRPSDGPGDFVAVLGTKALAERLAAYLDTTRDATGDLNEGVSALEEGAQLLTKATDLASVGTNGATDPTSFEGLAAEVDSLIERMIALGNTRANGRYLFGGAATQQAPFVVRAEDAAGRPAVIGYQGDDERARALIGPGQMVDTLYAGDQVFQSSGADVFQSLIGLRDALRDTTLDQSAKAQAVTQWHARLESARTGLLQTVSEQAAALEGLEAVQSRIQDVRLSVRERTGELEATDFAEAVARLQEQETAYQASLAMAARVFTPSLLDFLR